MNFELCETCQHYSFNLQDGILCRLTGQKPDFQDTCTQHIADPSRVPKNGLIYRRKTTFKSATEEHELPDLKESLRRWGIGLIVLGGVHILISDILSPMWGILIVILGMLNLIIHKREIFIVNGSALIFVGLLNLYGGVGFGGTAFWTFLGFFQILWGVGEIRKYRRYRESGEKEEYHQRTTDEIIAGLPDNPLRHSSLGIISVVLFGVIFIIQFVSIFYIVAKAGSDPVYFDQNPESAALFGTLIVGGILFGTIGAVLGIIDIFHKNRKKLYPIIGTVLNLLFVIFLILNLFTSLPT